jgi:AcrR family transcriptional regulator
MTIKGQRTRTTLIGAAFELFTQNGYHGTTMRQIAERAGLTVGSIYNHFNGKDAIFLAVVETYHPFNQIGPMLADVEGESLEQSVHEAARRIARVMEKYPGLMNLALIELIELDSKHMSLLVESFRPQVMVFIRRLASAPDQVRPISSFAAFRTFVGLIFAYELTGRLLQQALGSDPEAMGTLDDFVNIYLRGILRPPAGVTSGGDGG